MPIGLCPHCQRAYVLEHEPGPQNRCPCCHQPLKLISPAEDHSRHQGRRSQAGKEAKGMTMEAARLHLWMGRLNQEVTALCVRARLRVSRAEPQASRLPAH